MGFAIELPGIDAILDQDELDIADLQVRLFPDLTPERVFRLFTGANLPAGYTPQPGPLVRPDHQDAAVRAEDKCAHRRDR
jgi:hypothetical protein